MKLAILALLVLSGCATTRPNPYPQASINVRFLPGPVPDPESSQLYLCGWAITGEFTCVEVDVERSALAPSPEVRM